MPPTYGYVPTAREDQPTPPTRSGVPPIPRGRSWGKEPSGIVVTPPPPLVYIHSDHVVPRVIADKLEQIAKEMKIMTDQLDELARLQSLLETPNLSQANIDEINQQIGALLAQKRGEKKGEVWLDERK